MAKKKTLTGYVITADELAKSEIVIREVFLRGVTESLSCWGVEDYSIQEINGMLDMLRRYNELKEEIV